MGNSSLSIAHRRGKRRSTSDASSSVETRGARTKIARTIDGHESTPGGMLRTSQGKDPATIGEFMPSQNHQDLALQHAQSASEQLTDARTRRRMRRSYRSEGLRADGVDRRQIAKLETGNSQDKNSGSESSVAEVEAARTFPSTWQTYDAVALAAQVAGLEKDLNALRRSPNIHDAVYQSNERWDHDYRLSNEMFRIYEDDTASNEQQQPQPPLLYLERKANQPTPSCFEPGRDIADSASRRQLSHHSATQQVEQFSPSEQLDMATSTTAYSLTTQKGDNDIVDLELSSNASIAASSTALIGFLRYVRLRLEQRDSDETQTSLDIIELLPELVRRTSAVVRNFSSQEAELQSLRDQKCNLKRNFDHTIIAVETANRRSRDLEKALEGMMNENTQIHMRAQHLEQQRDEQSKNNEQLDVALDISKDELKKLERQLNKNEANHQTAIEQTQDDIAAKVLVEETGRLKAEDSALARLNRIQALEAAVRGANETLAQIQESNKVLKQKATHDASQISDLRSRITTMSNALLKCTGQLEHSDYLRALLLQRYQEEISQGEQAFEWMGTELIKAINGIKRVGKNHVHDSKMRLANWDKSLTGPVRVGDIVAPATCSRACSASGR